MTDQIVEHQIADPVERVRDITPVSSRELLMAGARVGMLGTPAQPHRRVVASWSGGIDSTAVLAHLCARGYEVLAVTFNIYGGLMARREDHAREQLWPELQAVSAYAGGTLEHITELDTSKWLWAFSADSVEIPHRNKRLLDRLVSCYAPMHRDCTNVALGEYTGADSWLVRDHVASSDADHRALASYLFAEYGLSWRLISLQDFGESRYKVDRVRLLAAIMGDAAFDTTVCLVDSLLHCGACYKCVERHAAFMLALGRDRTQYLTDPAAHADYNTYRQQMRGYSLTAAHANFPTQAAMPEPAAP